MVAGGRREWSGVEPAVGFAAIVAVEGLLARFPGNRAGPGARAGRDLRRLGLAAEEAGLPGSSRDRRGSGLPSALTWLLTAVPFIVSGRWGLLGMGYNNDLGLHLAWAESLRSASAPSRARATRSARTASPRRSATCRGSASAPPSSAWSWRFRS